MNRWASASLFLVSLLGLFPALRWLCPILIYLFYHIILCYSSQACYDFFLRRDRKEVALDGTGNHVMHGRNDLFLIKGRKEDLWW